MKAFRAGLSSIDGTDVVAVVGYLMLVVGVALWSIAAALIIGGAVLLLAATLPAMKGRT